MDRSLSVIFTVYNKESYVKKAIDCLYDALSLLTTPYEVIIIEDRSTDSSYEIIKEYGERDDTILLRNETNRGHFQTKCRGYLTAKNRWIMTIDGDDYVDREYIKEIVNALEEDTYLLLARNNRVNSTEITDNTIYWSIHNLPFMIFRRELIIRHKDYYSAEIPKSAWDDCIIVTPLYCQVTEMMLNGNPKALKHYKNVHRYNVNFTHDDTEIKGIAKCTLTKGIQLMKHLSDWTIRTGYADRFHIPIVSVLTQYLGVFRVEPVLMHPFVSAIHPKKDDTFIVFQERTESSKPFNDQKGISRQSVFMNAVYITKSFNDSVRALLIKGIVKNKPIIRIPGDCSITPLFYARILEEYERLEKEVFDVAGYTYNHKGVTFIDYSRPIIYSSRYVETIAGFPSIVPIQEALRLNLKAKTISLNELYDRNVRIRASIRYSLAYVPKIIKILKKPNGRLISQAIRMMNAKTLPIFYIKNDRVSEEENGLKIDHLTKIIGRKVLGTTANSLTMALSSIDETEVRTGEYWLICTHDMTDTKINRLIGSFWQLAFDNQPFDAIVSHDYPVKEHNRLKLYGKCDGPINIAEHGGIVRRSLLKESISDIKGVIYRSI